MEVKGCNFHLHFAEEAVWIGLLVKSLQLLPPDYVIPVWERLVHYPGPILPLQNGKIHPLILRFVQYLFFWPRQVNKLLVMFRTPKRLRSMNERPYSVVHSLPYQQCRGKNGAVLLYCSSE